MKLLNWDLLRNIILPQLFGATLWSVALAIAIGTVVGLSVGAVRRKVKQSMLPAIVGSFFGIMLFCMLPILGTPGIVGGGPYGALIIMMIAIPTLPVGSIGGAIAGITIATHFSKPRQKQLLGIALLGTYTVMIGILFLMISFHCSRPNTLPDYCAQAGYPGRYRTVPPTPKKSPTPKPSATAPAQPSPTPNKKISPTPAP